MDLQNIESLANYLLREYGLTDWKFVWDNANVRNGSCSHRRKRITLSIKRTPLRTFEATRNTILHEIAHALVGENHGHDDVWRAKAKEIGCTGETCSKDRVHIHKPFTGTCPSCSWSFGAHRRNRGSCTQCSGGKFNREFLIVWTKNAKQNEQIQSSVL